MDEPRLYDVEAPLTLRDVQQGGRTIGSMHKMLSCYKGLLISGMPRKGSIDANSVIHVFLDGAVEESDSTYFAGVGAVVVSEAGVVIRAFGYSISEETSKDLGGKIHQIELLPMVMACVAFGEDIRNRAVMFHIDNTAAQSALVNAGSSNEYSSSIVYT